MKLALLVYAAILACMSAPVASACSTSPQSDRHQFDDPRTIFRARIVATSLAPFQKSEPTKPLEVMDGNTIIKGQYQWIETFKGRPFSQGSVVSLPYLPGSCGIPLIAGWEYVFYVGEEHGDSNYVDMTGGSFGFFNPDGKQTKARLDQIRLLKQN